MCDRANSSKHEHVRCVAYEALLRLKFLEINERLRDEIELRRDGANRCREAAVFDAACYLEKLSDVHTRTCGTITKDTIVTMEKQFYLQAKITNGKHETTEI